MRGDNQPASQTVSESGVLMGCRGGWYVGGGWAYVTLNQTSHTTYSSVGYARPRNKLTSLIFCRSCKTRASLERPLTNLCFSSSSADGRALINTIWSLWNCVIWNRHLHHKNTFVRMYACMYVYVWWDVEFTLGFSVNIFYRNLRRVCWREFRCVVCHYRMFSGRGAPPQLSSLVLAWVRIWKHKREHTYIQPTN